MSAGNALIVVAVNLLAFFSVEMPVTPSNPADDAMAYYCYDKMEYDYVE